MGANPGCARAASRTRQASNAAGEPHQGRTTKRGPRRTRANWPDLMPGSSAASGAGADPRLTSGAHLGLSVAYLPGSAGLAAMFRRYAVGGLQCQYSGRSPGPHPPRYQAIVRGRPSRTRQMPGVGELTRYPDRRARHRLRRRSARPPTAGCRPTSRTNMASRRGQAGPSPNPTSSA